MATKSDLLAAVQHLHDEDVKSAYDFIMYLIEVRRTSKDNAIPESQAKIQLGPRTPGDISWKDVTEIIRNKISKPSYDTWFNHTIGIRKSDSVYLVQSKTEFQKEWLESKYINMISDAIYQMYGSRLSIEFEVINKQNEIT